MMGESKASSADTDGLLQRERCIEYHGTCPDHEDTSWFLLSLSKDKHPDFPDFALLLFPFKGIIIAVLTAYNHPSIITMSLPGLAPLYLPGHEPVPPGTTNEEKEQMQQMVKYQRYMGMAMESCPVKVTLSGGAGEAAFRT